MLKRVFAGLFLSSSMVAVGCMAEPVEPEDVLEEEGGEEIEETEQAAVHACPEQTWCADACVSVDRYWAGNCNDAGDCVCRLEHNYGHPGGGAICGINWSIGWGAWVCYSI